MYRKNWTCESRGKCGYFKKWIENSNFPHVNMQKKPIFEINVPWSRHKKSLLEYYLADKVT